MATWAQTQPVQWHHLDPMADKIIGVSTERAYELLKRLSTPSKPVQPVIVAVIDGGVDTSHVDLKSILWRNAQEVAGNGKDDDQNGYADDIYGWSFLGGKDGRNVHYEQTEETRIYARLKPLYEGKVKSSLSASQQVEYDLYEQVKAYYTRKLVDYTAAYQRNSQLQTQFKSAISTLKKALTLSKLDSALLHHPPTTDTSLIRQARLLYQPMVTRAYSDADSMFSRFSKTVERSKSLLDYNYNLHYEPRAIVGDHPAELTESQYGNADVSGPDPSHGTYVAGIIAADRINNLGVKGIADQVRILCVRSTPEGDERDKDVANAIRYAVNNGAKIINMSFGKSFSPEKAVVDEAVRYANQKGVLLVHAAGNDGLNLDSTQSYPSPIYLNGQEVPNLITIGASNRTNDKNLAATFSNYGAKTVDVFAPGVSIYSSLPGNQYSAASGTSASAPVVAGIAAVLKTYFPQLGPADLKRILMQSAVPYHTQVFKPGTRQLVDFTSLSKTGGIVNLYEAVKLAMSEQSINIQKVNKK